LCAFPVAISGPHDDGADSYATPWNDRSVDRRALRRSNAGARGRRGLADLAT